MGFSLSIGFQDIAPNIIFGGHFNKIRYLAHTHNENIITAATRPYPQ